VQGVVQGEQPGEAGFHEWPAVKVNK